MTILSNGFPTNMPDSEKVSQGGPANFEKLFNVYLSKNTNNHWIGLMYKTSRSTKISLTSRYNFGERKYYELSLPNKTIHKITKATEVVDASKVLKKPISLLVDLIIEKKPDIVFLNGFGIINWVLLKAAEQTNTPVVIQHAGIWTKELAIHKEMYSKHGRKIMEKMERDSSKLSSGEVFLNEWSQDYYNKKVAKVDNKNTCIIPLPFNFVDFKKLSSEIHESRFYFDLNKFHIGVIARWDNIKNHKLILSLAKEIKKNNLPWQIHTITDIPCLPKYKKIKASYEKYIDVIAPLDRSGISDFCNSVNLLIQPSIFDVSPTVVLEAISSKTPIAISENVGYVSSFKKHGAEDWVLGNDVTEVLRQIKKIAKKPMPLTIKNYLKRAHNNDKVLSSYLKLFSKVIKSSEKNK